MSDDEQRAAEEELNRQLIAFHMNSVLDRLFKKQPATELTATKPEDAPPPRQK